MSERPGGLSDSATYRALATLRRWASGSVVLSVLDGERVLLGSLSLLVLASVAAVFRSHLGAGVKFLSFALVAVTLAVLTERFVDLGSE